MKRRILGGTGMSVSEFALGAMMFGAMGNTDRDESVRMIHRALDAGLRFVNTADVYSRGESEDGAPGAQRQAAAPPLNGPGPQPHRPGPQPRTRRYPTAPR